MISETVTAIVLAVIREAGPELVLGLCCSQVPKDRARAILEAEYLASEAEARALERAKFPEGRG